MDTRAARAGAVLFVNDDRGAISVTGDDRDRWLGGMVSNDVVVLGHFHVEKDLSSDASGGAKRILVLPEWRESRRHLVARADGTVEFVDSD